MKKTFIVVLMAVFMMAFSATSAFAMEFAKEPVNIPGRVVAHDGNIQIIEPEAEAQDVEASTENEFTNNAVTRANVPRLDPVAIYICPAVNVDGETKIINAVGYTMIAEPTPGLSYIQDVLTREQQEALKNKVKNAGYEQVGWFYCGIYNLENIYNPMTWYYKEYTGAGASSTKGKKAHDGQNDFKFYSFFKDEVSSTFWVGIDGKVTYQPYSDGRVVERSIALTIKFE